MEDPLTALALALAAATIFVAFGWTLVIVFAIFLETLSYCLPRRFSFILPEVLDIKHGTAFVTFGWGAAMQTVVLIWLSVIATRGVPLMLHEGCGVVVIAMSPARGYLDSRLHYEGLELQVIHEAFGICQSLFAQTGQPALANCTSLYQIAMFCLHMLMVLAFIFWASSQVPARNVLR
jgi:hypothetical protein